MTSDEPPLTARRIVDQLGALARRLDELTAEYREADQDAARKREYATWFEARTMLAADGPVEARKADARVQAYQARLDAATAEATVRGLRQQIETLKLRIEVGRSTGTALRAEVSLASAGNAP